MVIRVAMVMVVRAVMLVLVNMVDRTGKTDI